MKTNCSLLWRYCVFVDNIYRYTIIGYCYLNRDSMFWQEEGKQLVITYTEIIYIF